MNAEGVATLVLGACQAIAQQFGFEVRKVYHHGQGGEIAVQLQFFPKGKTVPDQFRRDALRKGGEPSWYLKKFLKDGHVYTIVGWDVSRRRYPVTCWRDDGRTRCCDVDWVRRHLKQNGVT